MSKKIKNSVIDKIKKDHIKPKPKWEFLLKDYTLYALFALLLIIGGLTVSVIILNITTNHWDIHKNLGGSFIVFVLKNLPILWIVLFILFAYLTHLNYIHTRKGYKHHPATVITVNFIISILLGFALFGMGMAHKLERGAQEHFNFYRNMTMKEKIDNWMQIDKGLLGGEIIEIPEKDLLILKNFREDNWNIDTKKIPPNKKNYLKEGMIIGVIGQKKDDKLFEAERLKPFEGVFLKEKLPQLRNK